jgi:hypothetical protein
LDLAALKGTLEDRAEQIECVANGDATVTSCEPIGLPAGNRLRCDRAHLERTELGQHVLQSSATTAAVRPAGSPSTSTNSTSTHPANTSDST